MDLGPHAAFIWASYAAMIAGLAGLVAWLMFDGRRQQRALTELESRGITRRSQRSAKASS